ncbi:MAG: lysostaphin resistance A-like protein [Anaerovoracaceae bacterium]
MKNNREKIIRQMTLTSALICYVVCAFAVRAAVSWGAGRIAGSFAMSADMKIWANIIADLITIAVCAFMFARSGMLKLRGFGTSGARPVMGGDSVDSPGYVSGREGLMAVLAVFLVMDLSSVVTELMAKFAPGAAGSGVSEMMTGGSSVLAFFFFIIAAPVAEEMLIRGVLYNGIRNAAGWKAAVVFSALLWALMHMDLRQGAAALLMGLLLGFLYEMYDSLYLTIAIHMVNNIIYFFGLGEVLDKGYNNGVKVLIGVAEAACAVYCLWRVYTLRGRAGEGGAGRNR